MLFALRFHFLRLAPLVVAIVLLSDARAGNEAPTANPSVAPLRFLLSFDDGPSGASDDNPTEKILKALAQNQVQTNIKAIFFAQTRAVNGGGTNVGRALLKREFESGHLLALHTATPRHTNHKHLSPQELDASLDLGIADLTSITNVRPKLIRPPFWNFSSTTLAAYQQHGLQMLLTDLSANDGVIYGFNFSLTKRSNMRKQLLALRERWRAGALTQVDGNTPIVVTFHDVNPYTARHIEEYLQILMDVARELDMSTAAKPFYDERNALEQAALARVVHDMREAPELPGIWNWFWK